MISHVPWFLRQAFSRLTAQARGKSASVVSASLQCSEPTEKGSETAAGGGKPGGGNGGDAEARPRQKEQGRIVRAVFAALKDEGAAPPGAARKGGSPVDAQIARADSVEAILGVAELPSLSRHHALRIISVLSEWSASGRVKLADFEGDVRFIKLCRILGKSVQSHQSSGPGGFGDLAMVLGVTGDDEAAKLVAGISLPQMIRVMSALAQRRRRSTPLLRSLAFNIGRQEARLDMKQCADLLYAMSVLSFPDDVLLEKACADLCEAVPASARSSVLGSAATSLGLLRYKHTEVLDVLSEWMVGNADSCRPQDLSSLVLTLATVNHTPANADAFFDVVERHVPRDSIPAPAAWLQLVWSLFVLGRGNAGHAASVLSPEFLGKLRVGKDGVQEIGTASKLKLLNISGCAKLKLDNYTGPVLVEDSEVRRVPLVRSQEKTAFTALVFSSLASLLSSDTCLRRDIDTGMGFLLDGECVLDENCNPLPVEGFGSASSGKSSNKKATKIAIMALGYHDLCRGAVGEPTGLVAMCAGLLRGAGYKVLLVPHTDFGPHDKVVRRVQYLEQQLRGLVKGA